jgi:hypothetical protein
MYYDDCTYQRGSKTYRRELLRESRRVNGKVVKKTVANITDWPESIKGVVIGALGSGRAGGTLGDLMKGAVGAKVRQGKSVGAVATVLAAAKELGIEAALGDDRQGKLALFQVVARVIDQGSRLSAVRMCRSHAAAELIGLGGFDEDDLYENLSWLSARQREVEDHLFRSRYPDERKPPLFLYDVTSSYFEGERNAFAAFGYNRDGKKGKRQMVVGLLTDDTGNPLSIEVFPGNTVDTATVSSQASKLRDRFRGRELTLVGDRGMLKSPQRAGLAEIDMHYLTAITKAQITGMLGRGSLQMELFDQGIAEVVDSETSVRYILRRNPVQAARMQARRTDQLGAWLAMMERANQYLAAHPKAKPETCIRKLTSRAVQLKLSGWLHVDADGRTLKHTIDDDAKAEAAKLDGCYVLQTDLPAQAADAQTIDARYHDLSKVEWAFRTSKTVHLEMRPIHLRKEDRTRAHTFIVMLAYQIVRHLAGLWSKLDCTVEEAIDELAQLCYVNIALPDGSVLLEVPEPRPHVAELLRTARIQIPPPTRTESPCVVTKTKLTTRRT